LRKEAQIFSTYFRSPVGNPTPEKFLAVSGLV
jgi:hypothetical protein